jgi:spore maturation protein A
LNAIWVILIAASALFAVLSGSVNEFTKSIFDAAKSAVEVSLYLLGIVALWLGITKIIEDSGLIYNISRAFQPLLSRVFRKIPEKHPSITSITLNFLANMFGLGNAATPLGIKAMQDLQELNPDKDKTSFEMMLFIVLNTASIQIIPFTVIGILADFGSANPSAIILPTIIATLISAITAVTILFIFRKIAK